jgi:hypothetical protein
MKKSMLILASILTVSGLWAQQPIKPKRLAPASAQADLVPVTRAEARTVLATMQIRLSRGLNLKIPASKVSIPDNSLPVTRPEIVHEFNRMLSLFEPKFKFTPPKVRFDPAQLTLKDPAEKPALEKLIVWGAVAKLGPIAAGSLPTVTVRQFGDAVGFYMDRIAQLAYVPPSRWTPYLNGGRG